MPRDTTVLHVLNVLIAECHWLTNLPAVIPDLEVRSAVHNEDAVTLLRAQVVDVHVAGHLIDWGFVGHRASPLLHPCKLMMPS